MVFIILEGNLTYMLIPVRCFTCGTLVADKMDAYKKAIKNGEDAGDVMDDLGVKRYCCRRMLLTTVETIHQVIPFYEAMDKKKKIQYAGM